MPITALPTPPLPTDTPADFNTKAFALLGALPTFVTEANALEAAVDAGVLSAAIASEVSSVALSSANFKGDWSSLTGPLNIPASVSHNSALWLLEGNLADVTSAEPGVSALWIPLRGSTLIRIPRTSNTKLTHSDLGKWIDVTSGTFTQTFDAVAVLGNGWYCYIKNSGTGDIMLDPNASETIDDLTSYVMYPGEVRLVHCDGAALRSIVLNAFYKTFTASGTFTKPPGYSAFSGFLWGAGGSGGKSGNATYYGGGGGGGACVPFVIQSEVVSASETVTIGAAAPEVSATEAGKVGGYSSIGVLQLAYGGGGGGVNTGGSGSGGGGGGGLRSAGITGGGGIEQGGAAGRSSPVSNTSDYIFGGANGVAGGGSSPAAVPYYGGGGGAGRGTVPVAGGASIYGGGGGGCGTAGGASTFGGAGGAGATSAPGIAGVAPGGGGGGTGTGNTSGAGARGELRIWGVI